MDNLTPQEPEKNDLRAVLEASYEAEESKVEASDTSTEEKETKPAITNDTEDPVERTETAAEDTKEVPVRQSPKSIKKELADKYWSGLDPEFQDAITQRDADYEKGIEGYRSNAERGQAYEKAISPYMATINQFGVTPDVAVAELFKSDHTLRYGSPQQKLAMVSQIFRDYGIDPQQAFNHMQNGAPQIDPSIAPVYQELQELRQQQGNLMRQQQDRENQILQGEIARVAVGKEHWDKVTEDMAALLQASRATDLENAYEMAIWARPDLRAGLLQQERDKATQSVKDLAQAKRSAASAVSVNGSSPASTTSQSTNIRDLLAQQF